MTTKTSVMQDYLNLPVFYPDNSIGKMKRATWEIHIMRRQKQIEEIQKVTRAFEQEQRLRDRIKPFMMNDPEIDTEEAMRRAGLLTDQLAPA